jgi:hypothetical protein
MTKQRITRRVGAFDVAFGNHATGRFSLRSSDAGSKGSNALQCANGGVATPDGVLKRATRADATANWPDQDPHQPKNCPRAATPETTKPRAP